jgi:uncharacterized membrane protein YdjX (TVP38/TMEM64 family)
MSSVAAGGEKERRLARDPAGGPLPASRPASLALLLARGLTLDQLDTFLARLGPWAVVASIALLVLHSFVPFPGELVALANGMCFGPLWGTVVTWTGAMLGALTAFALARRLGRPFVAHLLPPHRLERLDRTAARVGWRTLLVARLLPLIAFNLINYGAGLTPVGWPTFFWTTAIGILPVILVMTVMGDQMGHLSLTVSLSLLALLCLLFVLPHAWRIVARRAGAASRGRSGKPGV